jgi:hypothetical protein
MAINNNGMPGDQNLKAQSTTSMRGVLTDNERGWSTTQLQGLQRDLTLTGAANYQYGGQVTLGPEDSGTWETGDNTRDYIGVKQWDVRDISCTVAGVLIDDLVSFEYTNARNITHIMSIREAVGYNLGATQPTFGIHIRSTSGSLPSLNKLKEEDRLCNVVLTAPSIMITCFAGIIGNIPLGPIGGEAPEITASGLAIRIAEYAELNRWIIQAGSLMANQNALYSAQAGLTNSLSARTDFAWQRRGKSNIANAEQPQTSNIYGYITGSQIGTS